MSYRNHRISLLLFFILILGPILKAQDQPIPTLTARVTDLTNTLSSQEKGALEAELKALEEQKGSQIVVLIIPTTDPEDIASYSMRVAEEWKIGRKGIDDGVLLLVAKNDRALRIEVGYGLEGAIPDVYSKRIIENIIIPNFRQGEFYKGIEDGVGAIAGLIAGEDLPAVTQARSGGKSGKEKTLISVILVVLFGLSILKAFIKNKKIKWVVVGVVALAGGFIFGSILFGAIGFGLSSFLMFSTGAAGVGGGRYYGGFHGGGGSSFGGGGFGGGGGGFGGGGASGGW